MKDGISQQNEAEGCCIGAYKFIEKHSSLDQCEITQERNVGQDWAQQSLLCAPMNVNQTASTSNTDLGLPPIDDVISSGHHGIISEKAAKECTDVQDIINLENGARECIDTTPNLNSSSKGQKQGSKSQAIPAATVPQSTTKNPKCEEPRRNENNQKQHSIREIHCGEDSILLLCEDSIYEPTKELLDSILERVYVAYMNATVLETSEVVSENEPPLQAEITLASILVFFRETAMIDNLLSHADVIREFYRLSLERRASHGGILGLDPSKKCNTTGKGSICFGELVKLIQRCSATRYKLRGDDYHVCVKTFCTLHLSKLENRPANGIRWILQEALNPELLQVRSLRSGNQCGCFYIHTSNSMHENQTQAYTHISVLMLFTNDGI